MSNLHLQFADILFTIAVSFYNAPYGKISVASEQLHVSGPTLSVSIKQLEAELELSLFVRSKNQMLLTPDGERLREKSADLVERFDRLKEDMRQTTREQLLIQIGAPSTLAEHLFRRVISDFTSRYKTALFEIPSLCSKEAAEQVADGRLELAICDQLAVNSKQLDFSRWLTARWRAMSAKTIRWPVRGM